jgi:hypothetical protein
MISFHRNETLNPLFYGGGFESVVIKDLTRIANGISRFVWSPIKWVNGSRCQNNFVYSYYAVLDFDNGELSLEQAKKSFCDVNHIIGTTRNHQAQKNGKPPCDRFRVLLEFEHPITDLRTYRYNMFLLCARFDADKACVDGARFFYPCREIVSVVHDADTWPVTNPPIIFENPESRVPAEKLARLRWQRHQQLAPWCDKFLKRGQPFDGKGREVSAFMVAAQMKLAGISEDDAYSLLLTAPIDRTNFDAERELRHAVRSAYKK